MDPAVVGSSRLGSMVDKGRKVLELTAARQYAAAEQILAQMVVTHPAHSETRDVVGAREVVSLCRQIDAQGGGPVADLADSLELLPTLLGLSDQEALLGLSDQEAGGSTDAQGMATVTMPIARRKWAVVRVAACPGRHVAPEDVADEPIAGVGVGCHPTWRFQQPL